MRKTSDSMVGRGNLHFSATPVLTPLLPFKGSLKFFSKETFIDLLIL